jgi:general secretion pathway protein G
MKATIKTSGRRASAARGFTLLEMVIVLGIIALILGAAITFSSGISETARDTAAEAKIKEIMSKMEAYRVGAGRYPTEQQGLQALIERPTTAPEPKRWKRQFQELPADPWGNDYMYRNPGRKDSSTFEIVSKGKDGELDTDDDISSQD